MTIATPHFSSSLSHHAHVLLFVQRSPLTVQYALKKPDAIKYNRKSSNKTSLSPFEDQSMIEFFSSKSDCSLFVFGTHSKKRPDNLVFGTNTLLLPRSSHSQDASLITTSST